MKKLDGLFLFRYYTDLGYLPVYIWWEMLKKKDYSLLLKWGYYAPNGEKVWERLQNDFIDEFGIDDNFQKILKAQIEIEEYKNNMVLTGDTSDQIFVDILEIELNKLIGVKKTGTHRGVTIAMEKYLGFRLNPKTVSTRDYYHYVNEINRAFNGKG